MKRDCNKFSRVGDILMTVPLSMPAKVDYNAAISYFVRSAQSTGQYAQILKQVGLTVANLASQKCQLTLIYSMRTQSRLSPVLQPHAARSPLVTHSLSQATHSVASSLGMLKSPRRRHPQAASCQPPGLVPSSLMSRAQRRAL